MSTLEGYLEKQRAYLEQQRIQYYQYLDKLKAELIPFKIGEKKEIYDERNSMQELALRDLAAQLTTDQVKVEIGHYVDVSDPDGPYGFAQSFHTITFLGQ